MSSDNLYNTHNLGEVIQRIIKKNGMQPKLDEAKIIELWEEIVGKMIARHTLDLYLKNHKLFIRFDSAALRQEISYAKERLANKVNQTIGHQCVQEVVLL